MSHQTELVRVYQAQERILYGPERQAADNQLDLASVASGFNSVMNSSPVKSSRMSTRKNKGKIVS